MGHKVLELDAIPDLVERVVVVVLIRGQVDPSKLRVLLVVLWPEFVKLLLERCADCGVEGMRRATDMKETRRRKERKNESQKKNVGNALLNSGSLYAAP